MDTEKSHKHNQKLARDGTMEYGIQYSSEYIRASTGFF